MSLALEYQKQGRECYCVLDDRYARDVAQKLELNVKGSILAVFDYCNFQ